MTEAKTTKAVVKRESKRVTAKQMTEIETVTNQIDSFTYVQALTVFLYLKDRLSDSIEGEFWIKAEGDAPVEEAKFFFDSPIPYTFDYQAAANMREILSLLMDNSFRIAQKEVSRAKKSHKATPAKNTRKAA